jgi:hypothetical protein
MQRTAALVVVMMMMMFAWMAALLNQLGLL